MQSIQVEGSGRLSQSLVSRRATADMEEYVIEWLTANGRLGGVCANVGSCADHATTHAHAQKHSDTCNEVGRRLHHGSVGFSPVKNAL